MDSSVDPHATAGLQVFEFPCNERVRTMLRLECLSHRYSLLKQQDCSASHEAALATLFELYDLLSNRSDIKNELLQELERQRQQLAKFEGLPDVSNDRLQAVIGEIGAIFAALGDVRLRLGAHMNELEFLMAIKGRAGIPAGNCGFDLPALSVWLKRDAASRRMALEEWVQPLQPLLDAVDLGLKLLRQGASPMAYNAQNGSFELSLSGQQIRLIRIETRDPQELVCDVSSNKYVVAIRFRKLDASLKLQPIAGHTAFELTLCDF
jgi:cell division protein ZapD